MRTFLIILSGFAWLSFPAQAESVAANKVEIGDIFASDGALLDEASLFEQVSDADYLLLGETHTSAATHRWQAKILEQVAKAGPVAAVVFEMIPTDLQPQIDRYLGAEPQNAKGLGAAVNWEQRGWPDWKIYQPIADIAIRENIPVIAGDLPRETIKAISMQGAAALGKDQSDAFGLNQPLPEASATMLREILDASHCGMLPEPALAPMATAQRARDGALADAMIKAAGENGRVVLIAGNGHVRHDFAVPAVLKNRDPDARTVVVGLLETSQRPQPFAQYQLTGADGLPLYDIVIFTGPHDDTDHCAELREQFGVKDK